MENVIAAVILTAVIVLAVRYVVKAKKSGRKCIGCPEGCCPHRGDGSACNCGKGD